MKRYFGDYLCLNIRRAAIYQAAVILLAVFILKFISFAQGEFTYDSGGKRNPFIPMITPDGRIMNMEKEGKDTSFTVEGIIYDKYGLSYAIVNGAVVSIGDTVGDYQVLKIEDKKIVFIKDGKPLEIQLKKEEQ